MPLRVTLPAHAVRARRREPGIEPPQHRCPPPALPAAPAPAAQNAASPLRRPCRTRNERIRRPARSAPTAARRRDRAECDHFTEADAINLNAVAAAAPKANLGRPGSPATGVPASARSELKLGERGRGRAVAGGETDMQGPVELEAADEDGPVVRRAGQPEDLLASPATPVKEALPGGRILEGEHAGPARHVHRPCTTGPTELSCNAPRRRARGPVHWQADRKGSDSRDRGRRRGQSRGSRVASRASSSGCCSSSQAGSWRQLPSVLSSSSLRKPFGWLRVASNIAPAGVRKYTE